MRTLSDVCLQFSHSGSSQSHFLLLLVVGLLAIVEPIATQTQSQHRDNKNSSNSVEELQKEGKEAIDGSLQNPAVDSLPEEFILGQSDDLLPFP